VGKRARVAAGKSVFWFDDRRLYNVDMRSRVVFSLGDSRSSCVNRGIMSYSLY
jgi:monomeric isocitrate dehydrogenase